MFFPININKTHWIWSLIVLLLLLLFCYYHLLKLKSENKKSMQSLTKYLIKKPRKCQIKAKNKSVK